MIYLKKKFKKVIKVSKSSWKVQKRLGKGRTVICPTPPHKKNVSETPFTRKKCQRDVTLHIVGNFSLALAPEVFSPPRWPLPHYRCSALLQLFPWSSSRSCDIWVVKTNRRKMWQFKDFVNPLRTMIKKTNKSKLKKGGGSSSSFLGGAAGPRKAVPGKRFDHPKSLELGRFCPAKFVLSKVGPLLQRPATDPDTLWMQE